MTVRKTFQWAIILLLLATAGGGGYAYLLWSESNERIRKAVLAKFADILPEWEIALDRAQFDWNRRIHLYDLTLRAKGQTRSIARMPEVVLTIDRELFAKTQEIVVQKVRPIGPILDLTRDAHGRWNWQKLPPPPKYTQNWPEWEIAQATVRVSLEQTDGSPAAVFMLKNANLKLIPSGKRRYRLTGLTDVSEAGKLTIDGNVDFGSGVWWFNGRMNDVTSSGELSGLAVGSSPELRRKLARMQAAIDEYLDSLEERPSQTNRGTIALASSRREATAKATGEVRPPNVRSTENGRSVPDLGASATLDVQFSIARRQPKTEPEFIFLADVRQGRITNRVLPFPLRDLSGKIYWDNEQFLLRDVSAKNGVTRVTLDGKFVRQGAVSPGRFDVSVSRLMLDKRLGGRLPAGLRRVYEEIYPAGEIDLEGTLVFDGLRTWHPHDFVMTLHNCMATHDKFPYTIHDITGTLTQLGSLREVEVDLQGRAGMRPVTMTGSIRNPGLSAEALFDFHVEHLPLDDEFIAACRPEIRKAMEALNLTGEADVDLTLYRPPGLNQDFQMTLSAWLSDASLEFVHFPYRLTNFSGHVAYSPVDQNWTFKNLQAVHGKAKLTGSGSFTNRTEPGLLSLAVAVTDAHFDKQLGLALPASLQEMWEEISPSGTLDLLSKIDWVPGNPPTITLPEVKVTSGSMTLRSFPYPLDEVEATFSYADDTVEITSFSGIHDHTQVRTEGFVTWTPQGDWRVRLVELYVDDLAPDRLFRRALPTDLRTVVEELDPEGPISLEGMLEFRGTDRPEDPVTAAWDVASIHSGGKLTTGVDLEGVFGRVTARGTWDGQQVKMSGQIDLDSVVIWDYQFTRARGPYVIRGDQVIVGSPEILLPTPRMPNQRRVPPDERVTAHAIGGVVTLDAVARLQDEPSYHAKLTLSGGRLEQYAQRYMTDARNLQGVMDGWVDLYGRGSSEKDVSGRGQLRINPAALYELPVMVQIVNVIGPPDNTAFRYAFLDFNIANSQYLFHRIDLVGDAFSLRGRGTAGFDGKLNLDFYSMLPRNQLPIPIVSAVVGEATKGWIGVRVRGKTDAPIAKVTPAPQLDEAMKRFLGAFGTRPPGPIPSLMFPPLVAPPRSAPGGPSPPPRTTRRRATPGR